MGYPCVIRRALVLAVAICATGACASFNSSPVTPSGGTWRLFGTINIVSGGQIIGQIPGASDRYAFTSLESGRFSMVIEASGFVSVSPVVALSRDIEVDFALRKIGETP